MSRLDKRIAIAALALGLGLCLLPVTGVLGPESALALGVLLPPLAAALAADRGHAARRAGASAGHAFAQSLPRAWCLLGLPVTLLGLNALRVKTCAPFAGLSFMVLGPLCGVSLAATVGASAGLLVPRRRLALALAVAVPLLALAVALYRLWATPAVYAFGHFFGYFPGTLYDRRVTVPDAWLRMRGLSAALGVSVFALTHALWDARHGARLAALRRHWAAALVGLACLALAGSLSARAEAWGLLTSREAIASHLGRELRSERCVLVVPRELPMDDALRLGEDCDFEVSRIERTLGVTVETPMTAYFFRSGAEKRRMMGAGSVYVAKPWRDEVYLQLADWPHPVLGHELAHVIAGRAGAGPFRIAGVLGGLLPEPTLIEGMAVALAWRPHDGLTPHQWARAAREAGVAPPLADLVGARFFSHNPALGYTLAGSFLRHVLEAHGPEALRRSYREGDVVAGTGQSLKELESSWHARLDRTPLPDSARSLAELRFGRPGVFSEVCPHEVARLRLELHGALEAGDDYTAVQRCQDILSIDARHAESRALLVGALARAGDPQAAEEVLQELSASPHTPRAALARAQTELADAAWRTGDLAMARALLRELQDAPQTEADRRVLEVKTLALGAPGAERELLRDLFVGGTGRHTDGRVATYLAYRLSDLRGDGLGDYLLARQLLHAGRHDLAERSLRRALERGLPFSRLTREALELHGTCAFAVGQFAAARTSFEALEAHPDARQVQKLTAGRWLARIRYVRDADQAMAAVTP